jgi:hypothetical protein
MRLRHFCWSVLRITMAIVAIAGGDALLQHLLHAPPGIMLGATLGTNVLTLADWAKRIGPDNEVATIIEMLNQTNQVLDDMSWIPANNVTSHRTTVRTGLPAVAWRLLNQGVAVSKSTTAQIDETIGLLEAWAEVDVELAQLADDTGAFRFSEAMAFIEAMNQEFCRVLFYGNAGIDPEKFTGLSVRYSDATNALNKQNIVKSTAGTPAGADQTSMWLIVWGPQTITGIFPKGSTAGLRHKDLGEQTAELTAGVGGTRMRVFQDQFIWKGGIALRDWRYVVRGANIDISNLLAGTGDDLFIKMTKMYWRIPGFGLGRAAFYVNRTVGEYLDLQAQGNVKTGGQLSYDVLDGRRIMTFRGIPIRVVDQLVETESIVT